jgi:ActR/RegA family two-component response regulator
MSCLTAKRKRLLPGWARTQKSNLSVVIEGMITLLGHARVPHRRDRLLTGFTCIKNLVEAVELILARCRAEIRNNAQLAQQEELQEDVLKPLLFEHAQVIAVENWKPEPELCDERARLTRREQRYERYQHVITLYEQGLGFTEITRRVGLSRRTIERWIKEGEYPEAKRRRKVLPARSANYKVL